MTQRNKIRILIVIVCISFTQGLQFSLSPVLSQIADCYGHVSRSSVQMLVTIPSLISIFTALMTGWIVLRIDRKVLLLASSLVAAFSGLLPLAGDSFNLLFCSRIIFGFALGFATTLNTAVVAEFFEGDERTRAMGFQGASIGTGMVLITTASGWLGADDYRHAYWIHGIGIIFFILIALCLPSQEHVGKKERTGIHLNREVFALSTLAFLEFLFLASFSTNISMHLQGGLAGNTKMTGFFMGCFSGIQIVAGLVLGYVTRITKRYTMTVGMLCFSLGSVILVMAPSNTVFLTVGCLLCGFSQGIFVPTGMVKIANAVAVTSTAMASAAFTGFMSMGQFLSPPVLNTVSSKLLGEISTSNVFKIASVGMTVSAMLCGMWNHRSET